MAIPASKERLVRRARQHYSTREFIFPSSDSHGHSSDTRFKLSPRTAARMGELISSGRFPYRTQGDFLRHAVEILVEVLEDIEPGSTGTVSSIAAYRIALESARLRDQYRQAAEDVEELIRLYRALIAVGDDGHVRGLVASLRDRIGTLPSMYRDQIMTRLKAEFPTLLEQGHKGAGDNVVRFDRYETETPEDGN